MQASITTTPDTSSRSTRTAVVIFGTYSAQTAADHGLGPHTAAHGRESQDHTTRRFPQFRSPDLCLRRVGRTHHYANHDLVVAGDPLCMSAQVTDEGGSPMSRLSAI